MTFGDRLHKDMQEKGLSTKMLADKSGVSYEYIRKMLTGERIPKQDVIEKLTAALDIDSGELVQLAFSQKHQKTLSTLLKTGTGKGKADSSKTADGIPDNILNLMAEETRNHQLPLYDEIALNQRYRQHNTQADATLFSLKDLRRNESYLYETQDDAMVPEIHKGDLVVVDIAQIPIDNHLVLALLPDGVYIRRCIYTGGFLGLIATNRHYDNIVLTKRDAYILHRITALIRRNL